ncbi:MAG: heptosyltransferase-2 [Verrucomicrobiales bacterium]|jgi:heptosyltransferase-2
MISRVFQYIVFLFYRLVEKILIFIPIRLCWTIGSFAGWTLYWFLPGYRKIVRRNLIIAMGDEIGATECRRIAHRHFCALGRNLLCSIKLMRMRTSAVEKRIRFESREVPLRVIEEGKGAIGAMAHLGPWEILAQISTFGASAKRGALYQPLSNVFLNRHVTEDREQSGLVLFDRRKGFYGPMKHIREGGGIGILVDQNAGNSGVWAPFFGRLASTSNLAALLATRTGAPILPVGLYPEGPAKWKIVYGEPIRTYDHEGKEVSSSKITAQINVEMEKIIRRAPEEWFWVHNRWKTPRPEFLLSGYRRGVEYPPNFDKEKDLKPFRILVRSPNWLGDACMAVPAVRAIKAGRPDAHVTVLCNENLSDLWNAVRHVDEVLTKPKKAGVFKTSRLIRMWADFDAGVLLTNSLRTALEMRRAKIDPIIGFAGHKRKKFLHAVVPEPKLQGPPEHHAWAYMRLAKFVGADSSDPELYLTSEHRPEFKGRWRIGICPGAAYGGAKRWPGENFARAIEQINERLDGRVEWIIYGAANEYEMSYYFQKQCDVELNNLVGQTSMGELMDELRTCHLLITNDTGTMHLAALLGARTVSIFGSTEPALTAPLGKGHRVLREHVECSPCFLRECPLDFRCMKAVKVPMVVEATLEIIEDYKKQPPAPAAAAA